MGIQMPFGRASWVLRALLADAPSPEGLRRQIAARAAMLVPCDEVAGRPTIVKRLVHLHVGDSEALRQRLLGLPVERLVHDEGMNLGACAPKVQRCRRHLVHQLNHYLWLDGMKVEQRRHYQKRLKRLLWRQGPRAPEPPRAWMPLSKSCSATASVNRPSTSKTLSRKPSPGKPTRALPLRPPLLWSGR